MDVVDLSYFLAAGLAGTLARAVVPALPEGWRIRLGAEPPEDLSGDWIWVHAVSVGELILAERLLAELRDRGHRLHVTTGTPAGLDLLQRRLAGWDGGTGRLSGGAFPFDDHAGLRPWLLRPPAVFLALETEIWPNLLRELSEAGVRTCIVNGRLTPRSLSRGRAWLGRAAGRLDLVVARDAASEGAFRSLGAPEVVLGGNLKADAPAPRPLPAVWEPLREGWAPFRVLVAGNTVEGEEALVLRAWREAREAHPGLRLILAPRQPRRFQAAADLLEAEGLAFRRASGTWPEEAVVWGATDVLLLDTLGDLGAAYGEGSVALVAGGWTWHGGHNPLEGVRWGIPTLVGPGFANFEDLVVPLREAGQVVVVEAAALGQELVRQVADGPHRPERPWGAAPLPQELSGTLMRTILALQPLLPHTNNEGQGLREPLPCSPIRPMSS